MAILVLESVKTIEQQYRTGEEPVLVTCSDMNAYVCKYMRSSAAAYKLVCELIGSRMAMAWQIETPDIAFVFIKSIHWGGRFVQHSVSAPSLGSKRIESVVDVTSSMYGDISPTTKLFCQLMEIALFDFWLCSDLFQHLLRNKEIPNIDILLNRLENKYVDSVKRSKGQVSHIVSEMPKEWHVSSRVVEEKLKQLFDEEWTAGVWDNFVECLKDNING